MTTDIRILILSALATLITLSIHEFFHAFTAYKLGDNTARNLGRLTLNPIKHLDPIGALCMIVFRFGWARPVPISPRNFKKPRRDFAISALMGPVSNLITALFAAFLYLFAYAWLKDVRFESEFLYQLANNSLLFLIIFHQINIGIAVFNLIPVPPLDGSRILTVILPPRTYFKIMRYERTIYWILIGWLFVGDVVSRALLSFSFIAGNPILSAFAKILSLSDILAIVISYISRSMMSFWQLIPFLKL